MGRRRVIQANLLESADYKALFAHVETMKRPQHYRLLLTLMRDLGLRPIELAHLQSSWFRGTELRIPTGQSKRGRARTLPTSPEMLTLLAQHMGARTGTVFVNRDGDPFTPGLMTESVRRLFKMAGVSGSAYSCRRTMASKLVEKDVNIITIQHIMGHSSADTTQKYVSVSTGMMERALFA